MTEKLKPCPFCGSEAVQLEGRASCANLKCMDYDITFSVDTWNNRPIEDALRAEIAELKAQLRWIPVEERLPEHAQVVLASNGRSVTEAKYYYFGGQFLRHGWYQIDDAKLGVSYATHWRPMPAPPETQP